MSSQPTAAASERTVVMIVAAHAILRNAIYESLLLMQPDWEHVEVQGAEQALALVAAREIDIALVDAGVATEDAEQTVRAIKAAAPRVEIVVLTDSADPVEPAACQSAGASACVRKRNLFAELEPLLPALKLLAARRS